MKAFFTKNWIHFAAFGLMLITVLIYFQPQLDGYGLKQHDVEQWRGMAHETQAFRENNNGEEPLWTNSMFGGMPTVQITMKYPGNIIGNAINGFTTLIPGPMGIVLLHLIGFYILGMFLRIRPIVALIGAIAFSFASYEIIIIQAGHVGKAMATIFIAPALGAFIYSYRQKSWLGVLLFALFMACELAVNHVQVTYYFGILLLFLGVYFAIRAVMKKEIVPFFLMTAGLIGGLVIALLINNTNLQLSNDYAKHTIRGKNDITIQPNGLEATNQSKGLDRDYITQWSYGIEETFTLVSPNIKGGGSFTLKDSQFEDILDQADISSARKNDLGNYGAYWGDQPFTSGPVYIGAVVIFLAFLGLFFIKSNIKWVLLGVSILCVMLSWGKNFMGLTNFFIDHVPGYDKFRTVTIVLVIVELCLPVLAVLFIELLIREREAIKANKNKLFIAISIYAVFIVGYAVIGSKGEFIGASERAQLEKIEADVYKQIASLTPEQLQQYGIDPNNSSQISQIVAQQKKSVEDNYQDLQQVRKDIFKASMFRTILFTAGAAALVICFVMFEFSAIVFAVGLLVLTMIDVIPVASDYLGKREIGSNYKYWEDKGVNLYPMSATSADEHILASEISGNSALEGKIQSAEKKAKQKADEEGIEGPGRRNLIDSYRFAALNANTNYRVFDMTGGFSSSQASYFHKSLGGYHGAKLRNIANLMDFHLARMNNRVYDMMNVKYIIQMGENGEKVARPNPTALGNAWLVKDVETFETPNDEILALGTTFKLENKGVGRFFVNGKEVKEATIYGAEDLKYLLPNSKDTLTVPLTNGMSEGMEAMYVMDVNGNTNLVPLMALEADQFNSFLRLVQMKAVREFKPEQRAVMLKTEAAKLSKTTFSGEGRVTMTKYAPNKLVYDVDVKDKQLVVFSEIYYPEGWTAYVDGKEMPILKVNYLLRGVEVPAGKHKVEMKFDLPKYHSGNKIALISSIALILGIIGLTFFQCRKSKKEENVA